MFRRVSAIVIFFAAARLGACECVATEPRQLFLGRAQFVAEVSAPRAGELVVERVIRGLSEAKGRSIRVPAQLVLQRAHCCDRIPAMVVVGEKYWVISPEQPRIEGQRLDVADVQVLEERDRHAAYLASLHNLTPEQLRALLNRWKSGSISTSEFATYIDAVDLPSVSACIRGYYHRLLMNLVLMAQGNEDHAKCDLEGAGRVRVASAAAALATLSFIQDEGAAGRLVCARNLAAVTFMPNPTDQQIRQSGFLSPCVEERAKLPPDESQVMAAALDAYSKQMYGGSGGFLLYQTTVRPSPSQLEVHVFSPENGEAAQRYASADSKKLRDNLRSARRATVSIALPPNMTSTWRIKECGEFPRHEFIDAVAVSRAGFDGTDKALVYLEYAGGARAYHLLRREGRWEADWYVELWACG